MSHDLLQLHGPDDDHGSAHDHDHDHAQDAAPAGDDRIPLLEQDGKVYVRSLDQLAETPEFRDFARREFPENASEMLDPVSRRSFLSLMGASVALAGFGTGCVRRPEEYLVPYGKRPEDLVPGLPQFYATAMSFAGNVTGLVVESHEGRPTKVEGNTQHPASLGAASSVEQGAILSVYDPDRITSPQKGGAPSTWAEVETFLAERRAAFTANGGQGLVIVHGRESSPAFDALAGRVRAALPSARFVEWEAISADETHRATELALGARHGIAYAISAANVILAVDDDLFGVGPFRHRYARDWAMRRNPDDKRRGMNRLYVAEPVYTVTGASADHRMMLRRSEAGAFLRALAGALAAAGVEVPAGLAGPAGSFDPKMLAAVAKDLAGHRGKALVTVGGHHRAEVQALALAINAALGAIGPTLSFTRAPAGPPHAVAIADLAQQLEAGQVDTLVVLGGNPAYDAPAELRLADLLGKARHRIHLTGNANETSELCEWLLPQTHFLEAWGDAVSPDGTQSIVQPLIQPIWGGRSALEVLALIGGEAPKGFDLVRTSFLAAHGEAAWRKALHDGVVPGTGPQFVQATVDATRVAEAVARMPAAPEASAQALELTFLVETKTWDGRFANNAWLQELPEPMTKLTWTNALLLSPKTAGELGLLTRDEVEVEVSGRKMPAAVWIQPGTADGVAAIALGYGRRKAGRIGEKRGYDAFAVRTSDAAWIAPGARVRKTGGQALLPSTQDHHFIEGRPLVREGSREQYEKSPTFAQEQVTIPAAVSLWADHKYDGQQWGLTIDLNACIGCNGCMIACQAENNIPVVGPAQVHKGREMHWIRLDRYFVGHAEKPSDWSAPAAVFQPMTCQQCENAPCETVCPVAATVHSHDGLNDMVYNRCIGTRYCSNNCPWKVRRFNFLNFHQRNEGKFTEVEQLHFNPDVTVRSRGVMEKCTYCVQRIHEAKRDAKLAGKEKVPDGAIVPACAQACPTQAIVFGDINDPDSRVARMKKNPRNYLTLEELNTRPRTSYLAKIRNPNPELA